METHGPDGDTVAIWTYAGLSIVRTFCGAFHLRVIIHGSGSQLSLHVGERAHTQRGVAERVPSFSELANPLKHGRATRQYNVGEQALADVNIALHDALDGRVVASAGNRADEAWREPHIWATETLDSDGDDVFDCEFESLPLSKLSAVFFIIVSSTAM